MNVKPSDKIIFNTFIYCIFISFIMLLFTSNNSLLYESNSYYDNYLFNGINGLNRTILFILEVGINTVLLFYSYKIFRLFINRYSSKILIPILMCSVVTSSFYGRGGNYYEYVLSLIVVGLYYYLRHFKKKMIENSEMFICGILAGLTFIIDYYLFGFWIGFCLIIVLDYFINRKQKKNGFKHLFSYLIGILIVVGLMFLKEYYFKNIDNYLNNYYINRFNINFDIKSIINDLKDIGIICYWIILISPLGLIKLKINGYSKIGLIIIMVLMILGINFYINTNNMFILFSLYIIGLLGISNILDDRLYDFIKYYYKGIIIVVSILCILFSIYGSNYLYDINLLNNNIVFKK